MKPATRELLITVGLGVISVAVAFGGGSLMALERCTAKWQRSGLASEWGLFQGCLVRLPDGRWLPEERLREIEIKDLTTEPAEPAKPVGRITT